MFERTTLKFSVLRTPLLRLFTPLLLAFFLSLGLLGALYLSGGPSTISAAGFKHYVAPGANCGSVSPCYATIQAAVDAAAPADEILVAAGLYTGTNNLGGQPQVVYLNKTLTVQGGFTTSNWLAPEPQVNLTIIDAQNAGRGVFIAGSASPTIQGFHIRNGTPLGFTNGGGIFINTGAPQIINNQIYSNTGGLNFGGGIYNSAGSPHLERNLIYSNTAGIGGGFATNNGAPTSQNNIYRNNQATATGGGGLVVGDGTLVVRHDLFYNNTSLDRGGGLLNAGVLTVTNTIILSNTADDGGGLFNIPIAGNVATSDFNIFHGNNASANAHSNVPVGLNSQTTNPFLFDPLLGRLASNSPAIDAATPLAGVTEDLEGNGRPFGFDSDIGPDEFTDTGPICYARLDGGRVYTNIQQAVDDSAAGSLIQVAGLCVGVTAKPGGLNQTLYIDHDLTVRGGYTATNWVTPRYGPTLLDATDGGRGIYVTGTTDITLENLHVTGGNVAGPGGGIFLGNDGASTLHNNVIYDNQATGSSGDGGGLYLGSSGATTLQHNTVFDNDAGDMGGGLYASNDSGPVTLANTIVANNTAATSGGGVFDVAGGKVSLRYNNFFQNLAQSNPNNYGGVTTGTTDIFVNPGFVNAVGGNFHLDFNTSAIINRADPASPLATDFENDARPQGTRADIGADESLFFAEVDVRDLTLPANPRVVTDTALIANSFITFTHTVTNLSNIGSGSDTFVITTSNSNGWQVSLAGIVSPVVLTTNVPVQFSVVVSVPSVVPAGLFNRTIITFTSQTNPNVFDATTDIIANPRLELTPNYTDTADPGTVLTYTHTLTNSGPVTETINVSLNSPLGWGSLVAPTTTVTLGPGQSRPVTVRVEVANTAPANLVETITVIASSQLFGISAVATDTVAANIIPGDRYVATTGSNFNNNCTQKATPCARISHAVNQAVFSDTVFVAQGFYNDTDINIVLKIDVRGGYASDFNLPAGGINPATTIINAAGGRGFSVNLASVFPAEINGFTIQNANPSGLVGGAIFLQGSSSPRLRNLILRQSSATQGAGIYITGGAPILDNVIIDRTTASNQGGGIYINAGSPRMNQVVISNTIATNSGGAIYLSSGTPLITSSTIYSASAANGGGIYQNGGTLTAYKLKISDSRANNQGGGLFRFAGTSTISQTQVGSNTATAGAGIYNNSGSLNLWNSLVYSNTATSGNGAGIYNAASLSAINNTIFGNSAAASGGGVFNNNTLVLSNTIVVANSASSGGGINQAGGSATLAYNNVFGNSGGNYNGVAAGPNSISADPLFVSVDPADLSFLRLRFDSPSVDSASPNTFINQDIDDDLRPVNQGFDMGADEVSGCLARLVRTDQIFGVVQDAIDVSISGDTIQISGICRGVLPRLVDGQIISQTAVITNKNLTLAGGFDATFNPTIQPSILDAQGMGRTVVVSTSGNSVGNSVKITNLHLTGGNAANLGGAPGGDDAGGGLYSNNTLLELVGSVITGNQATIGGGLYALNGQLTLGGDEAVEQTTVQSNTATLGAGLYLQGVAPGGGRLFTGEGLFIRQNEATEEGGGLYVAAGTTGVISQTDILSNSANLQGGGLYNAGVIQLAQAITNAYNLANSGAGVYNTAGGRLDLQRSTVLSNAATSQGGGFFNAATGVLTLTNTIVASNTSGAGAGLYNLSQSLVVRHGTFYRNNASGQGGGIYYDAATPPLINSTLIISNTASGGGGGIFSVNASGANFRYNDVFGNTSTNYGGIADQTGINFNISANPQFLSVNSATPNFLRIAGGSPAEDGGDPASPVIVDIDQDPRPSNQDPDIGVDEVSNCFVRINGLPPTYGNIQVAIGQSSNGAELRVAGSCQGVNVFVDATQTVSQTAFLTKSLTILGGYTNLNWTVQDPVANPTFLNALDLGRVLYITNSARITVDGLRLTQGRAGNGGAIFVGSGALTMTRNSIYSSTATGNGGALYNAAGAVHLFDDNQVYSNTATVGGAFYNAGGTALLEDNLLLDNEATAQGGAFFHAAGASQLWNNIIRLNGANQGGAISSSGPNLTVWHNTFVANSSAVNGAGFYTTQVSGVSLRNNIFYNHNGLSVIHSVPAFDASFNGVFPNTPPAFSGLASGTNITTQDPLFLSPATGDYHLNDNSPLVDKGDPTVTLFVDFDDDETPANPRDLRPGGQGFDLGADEIPGCRARVLQNPSVIYGNIQLAINNSQPGNTVQVTADRACGGVHPFNAGGQVISQTAHITHNLTLVGGYREDFSSLFTNPSRQTVINPLGFGRAVLVTGTTQVTMQNFSLENGNAAGLGGGPGGAAAGGGLYYRGTGGSLSNVRVFSSTAAYGGGVFNGGSGLAIITGSIVTSNTATFQGGGIYNGSDALTLVGMSLNRNKATHASNGLGGGLYNDTGLMNLRNNVVFSNTAVNGGGFYNNNSPSILDFGNHFYRNEATSDGAAIYSANGGLRLWNNFLYRNLARDEGGAIYLDGGSPIIRHNTFYANSAPSGSGRGGAIYIDAGSITIQNNIFDSNTASSSGSAIFNNAATPPLVVEPNAYWPGAGGSQVFNINLIGTNPNLNPQFVAPNVDPADLHLREISGLIDHPAAIDLSTTIDHDFEDHPRPVNLHVEMGADEYSDCLAQVASTGTIYGRIQDALDAAAANGTVRVAQGTCFEHLDINKPVTVSGRWEKDFSGQDFDTITTIDASLADDRVITIGPITTSVSLGFLDLTNGDTGGNGGAIFNQAETLSLTSMEIYSNTAASGGGVYQQGGVLTITGGGIEDNTASNDGGGVYIASGEANLTVQINNNLAQAGNGGAIYNGSPERVEIIDEDMLFNSAGTDGGSIYNAPGSNLYVTGIAIDDSTASGNGGGIYNNGAALEMYNNNIQDSEADNGAGIYITGNSPITLTNLGLFNNTTTGNGGGLYRQGSGSTALYHATIAENTAASEGGGIYNTGASMVVSASIIAFNDAPIGSGIQAESGGGVTVVYTLKETSNDYEGLVTLAGSGNILDVDPRIPDRILDNDSPAIDTVPDNISGVEEDMQLHSRNDFPIRMCQKDMGWDEFSNERRMSWLLPSTPTPPAALVAPTESVTYTFFLNNDSRRLLGRPPLPDLAGTGYTETVTVTINSNQGWATFVEDPQLGIISGTVTATFEIGSGETAALQVRVTVPPGQTATVIGPDEPKDSTRLTYVASLCADEPALSGVSAPAVTRVEADRSVLFETDQTGGLALPGQVLTFTHILTNTGNITDTYLIVPGALQYMVTPVVDPADFRVVDVAPGESRIVTLTITIDPAAAGGLVARGNFAAISESDVGVQDEVIDTVPISFTSGTRHVSLEGQDALDQDSGVDSNNCTQPQIAACRTLQHALSQAAPGDLIKIEQGVYSTVLTDILTVTHQSQVFTQIAFIDKSITLQGGYNRNVTPGWDAAPNHISYTTSLDPQDLGRAIYIATTEPVTIDRLTLLNGNASAAGGPNAGGLIYNEGADLTLHANRLQEGSAGEGGALYHDSGDLILQNNMVHDNSATTGGAVYVAGGNTSLENNTFFNNQAGNGGAAYIDAGNLVVTNTIFANNNGNNLSVANGVSANLNYNLYNGNASNNNYAVNGTPQAPPGANNVFGSPLFINPASTPPDLHIQSGSAARDTGSPATTLNIDYDNNLRPLPAAGSFDIGADERVPVQSLLFYSSTFTSTLVNDTVVITHFLQNTGDVTDTYTITASSSQGWPFQFRQPLPYTITLGSGISQTVVVTYTVPATASGQTNLTVITATSSLSSIFEIVTDEIKARSAAWEISKQVTPDTFIQPGGSLTYTITITNVGDLNTGALPYTITDVLPEHTNFVSANPPATPVSSTLQWVSSTDLITGQSLTFSYVVTVTQPLTDELPIVNQIYSVQGGGAPVEVFGAPVTVTVEAGAILSASKSANASLVQPGDFLTYTLTITNQAGALAPATNVLITDTLPAQAIYQSMGFVGATTGLTSANGSNLSWQLAEALQPGDTAQVTVTVRITSPLAAPANITNTFGVTSSSISGVISDSLTTAITATNDIVMSKVADPVNVASGGTVTYTLTLTNSGNGIATVSLTDTLASGFSPATYLNTVQVPGRDWTTDGVTTVSFTATVPITGGVYSNPAVTATFGITSLTLVNTAPITVEAAITGLALVNDSPTSLGQPTLLTATITGGNDVSYTLDFGDSSGVITGTLTSPLTLSHTYPTSGTFIAIITATNNVSTQVATTTVIIQEAVAGLTLVNNSPTPLGQATTLTATITAGSNVTYTLNFGDGTTFDTGALSPNAPLPINHTYAALGTYTATITATNGTSTQVATTSVTIVASPPRLIAPPNGTLTRTQTITFSWSTVAGAASYNFSLDGGLLDNITTTFTSRVLAEGVHTWTVASVDAFGQSSVFTDNWTITVDITPPSIPAPISPVTGTTLITNAVVLSWTASTDNLSGVVSYTVLITRGGVTTPTTVGNVTSLNLLLADGVYTWTVQAVDGAGNRSAFSAPQRFRVDSQGPAKPILISPPNGTITRTANINLVWSQVSPQITYTLHLSGDTFLIPDPGTNPVVSPTVLADGVYTWTVEAVDSLDRTSGVTTTWTFTVDVTAPSIPTPISPTAGQTILTSTVPFNWGASTDNLSGVVSYTLVVTGPSGTTTTNLGNVTSTSRTLTPDGDYSWSIQAFDAAGNPSGFTAPISFTVDATGPARPILIAPPNGTITNTQAITLEWSDVPQAVTYTLRLNGAPFNLPDGAGTSIVSPTVLAEGVYTWSVEAIDNFNRSSGLTNTWVFTIDLTAPAVPVLIAPPDGTITRTNPLSFSWSSVEPGARYNLQLTYGLTTTLFGPFTTNQTQLTLPFGEGVYTWTVQAIDRAGNTSAFAAPARTVTLDTTAPTPPILLTPPDGSVFTQTGTITFSWTPSVDAASGPVVYTLIISGRPPQTLSGTSQIVNFTTDGVYTWTVSARDQAGNSVITDTFTFVIDNSPPPKPVLLSPPDQTFTNNPNVIFSWRPATDTVTYTLNVNGSLFPVLAPTTSQAFNNLAEGVYIWTVRSADIYSRTLGYTDSWRLVVDLTPPTLPSLISPTNGAVISTTARPVFDWANSTDALSGPVTYTVTITNSSGVASTYTVTGSTFTPPSDLPVGVYTWRVQAFDRAGNSSSAGPFTVTIQAPTTTLFLPLLVKVFSPDGPPPPPNLPDLVIDDITLIKKAGNTYTVRVTARNRAATPVTFGNNFFVNVYLDGNLNSPIIGFGVQASWFGAGQSRVLEQDYTFSSGGPHTLRAWADPFNTVVEGVETNNTRDLNLTVAGAAQGVTPKENQLLPPGPQPTPTTIPGSR